MAVIDAEFTGDEVESICLLAGHLVGDYILQNDWMASRKASQTWPCVVHCVCYAIAIAMFSFWFLSAVDIAIVGVLHFPVDRWRLARKFMTWNGQESFATGPLAPWSIIVVDNTIHIVVLAIVGMLSISWRP